MPQIKFLFRPDKFVNAVAFFATAGVPDLTTLKVLKLLYLADKKHLRTYGRPITGDRYVCMDYGPVPSDAYNLLNESIGREAAYGLKDASVRDMVNRCLGVSKADDREHPVFTATKVDEEVFSESDLETLAEIVESFGSHTASDLVSLTHEDATWRIPDRQRTPGSSVKIPFELFFEDDDATVLEEVRDTQDLRDMIAEISA